MSRKKDPPNLLLGKVKNINIVLPGTGGFDNPVSVHDGLPPGTGVFDPPVFVCA